MCCLQFSPETKLLVRRDKGDAPATEMKEFAQVDGQVEMTKRLKGKPGALTLFYPPSLRIDRSDLCAVGRMRVET